MRIQRSWVWGIIATGYDKWFYESEDSNVGFFRIMVPWEPKDPANVAMLPKEARGIPCPTDQAGYQIKINDCGRVKFLSVGLQRNLKNAIVQRSCAADSRCAHLPPLGRVSSWYGMVWYGMVW